MPPHVHTPIHSTERMVRKHRWERRRCVRYYGGTTCSPILRGGQRVTFSETTGTPALLKIERAKRTQPRVIVWSPFSREVGCHRTLPDQDRVCISTEAYLQKIKKR